ncbi:MAG TPA: hypothetical protein VFG08_08670 [Candidatus Polarisedimenticolia bacterium]|nr:hypothetical protein [Candidatus Polarisedimenticolia bacterium]
MAAPCRVLLTALLTATLPGPPALPAAAPQEPFPAQQEPAPVPFIEREEVRFVTLDIVAEEQAGGWRPLRHLTIGEIEIRVGGRLMPIDLFEDHCRSPRAGLSPPADESQALPPPDPVRAGAAAQSGLPGERTGVRYILYFDMEHLDLAGRDAAFKAAVRWAGRHFEPDDEVMIITAGRALRIIRTFLPAADRLREDLEAARNDFRNGELWGAFESVRLNELGDEKNSTARRMLADAYAAIDRSKTENSLSNLRDVMTIFAALKGTKNLVLFADTIRLLPGMQYGVTPRLGDVQSDLQEVAAAANERNVRIYPVKAGLPPVWSGSDPRLTHADSAFTFLADQTGGKVFEGSNAVDEAFGLVDEDLACFYRAGFRIRPLYSGRVEPILVRLLDREGAVRLRYRQTLEDPTREDLDADMIRAAFMAPSTARAFPIAVRAATLFRQDQGARLQVEIGTPLGSLLGLPQPGGRPGARQVRVEIGARVVPLRPLEQGAVPPGGGIWADVATERPSSGFARQAILTLPHDQGADHETERVIATGEFDAPPGRYGIVAVIQDQLARTVAAAVTHIEVGAAAPRIGEIGLASGNRDAVMVPEAPAGEPAGNAPWNGKELAPAWPILPPGALLNETAIVEAGGAVHLIYSVCPDPPGKGEGPRSDGASSVGGRDLERILTCGPGNRSVRLPPRNLPTGDRDLRCLPLLDSIPADALPVGRCRFDLILSTPGGEPEHAAREFTVVPPTGRHAPGERPAA